MLETQLLAGHDGFEDQDALASQDIHTGIVQLRHNVATEGVALGALDISWSRARYIFAEPLVSTGAGLHKAASLHHIVIESLPWEALTASSLVLFQSQEPCN